MCPINRMAKTKWLKLHYYKKHNSPNTPKSLSETFITYR